MVKAINEDEGYQAPAWAEDFAKTPGPAAYLTDKFLRDEQAGKALREIPNLGKAMNMGI